MEPGLLELLSLPQAPHVEYEDPPLVLALCQIKFAPVLSVANPAFVAGFQRAIEDQYPITNAGEQIEVEFGFGPGETGVNRQSRLPQWRFVDESDTWVVVLTQDFLSLETRSYGSFEDFLDRLKHIVQALVQHIKPKFATRLGLRYINEIRPEHMHWTSILKPNLLGLTSAPELAEYTQLAMQQMVLRFPNERGINIHHGYFPGGSTIAPRGGDVPREEPFYLLDLDVFREFQPTRSRSMNPDDICRHIAEYNKTIYQLFRWCTTDEYITTLEVRREDSR